MSLVHLLLVAIGCAAALTLVMGATWVNQQKTKSSRWVDATWSFNVGAVACAGALFPMASEWPSWRQVLIACCVATWALRLSYHIAARASAVVDDPRYRKLAQEWGRDAPRRMFWFLQSQAAVGTALAISMILAAHNHNPTWRTLDSIGIAILAIAIAGEALADRQLNVFKQDPKSKGQVCSVGLWRWSRHPNYFFEWLFWVAYPILAIDFSGYNPYGWVALAAPAIMYWALVYVSGIPPLEAHMLETRGEAFRTYQTRTSAFFPFSPH